MQDIDESAVPGGKYLDDQGRWHNANGEYLDDFGKPLPLATTDAELELVKLKAFVAEKYPEVAAQVLPGESFSDAMIRLLDPSNPPTDPVEPPTDPVEPPTDPVEPPTDPVEPPTDPVEPPVDPADAPLKTAATRPARKLSKTA